MLNLQRGVPWARLAPTTRRVEQRILTEGRICTRGGESGDPVKG